MNAIRQLLTDNGLVLHVPFFERDGFSFASADASGHLCTINGAAWRTDGRYFDGIDDCGILPANRPALNVLAITIECWLKLVSPNGAYDTVVGTNSDIWGLDFPQVASASPRFFADCVGGFVTTAAPAPLDHLDFYHLVGTYDATNGAALYVNRDRVATCEPRGPLKPFTGFLSFGAKSPAMYTFNIVLGEARIYDRALTSCEIQHNFLASAWRYR